ncbi:HEAT repeat domain-containing protein [Leptothoe spongobia]|uniref:HEAT repeat domain-containing protein n=1 Tax=Leptothoe spongobia TAU-MAC 1115 TaxID=1967444 RepID=A0A947GN02_9CYAN|nr:HEAT repeat domain-containing protein [Leptothoe spongobia]MBT9317982.1 HEAT repeat domain-containing protein [Leptothoe spongobia TAU-MAC 1115]
MIWRSTLVFLTSLSALTLPVESLRAESGPLLFAQSSVVDPNYAIDTGQTTPNVGGPNRSSLQSIPSEQQIKEIKAIQQELKNRGYYNGPIDGIYGPVTAEAIRVLRGQEGNQSTLPPSLLTPDPVPDKTSTIPEEVDKVTAEPIGDSGTANPQDKTQNDDIQVNAADVPTEEINIGEEVSPETGTSIPKTASDPDASEANISEADSPRQSPGLGNLLWLGLALIAALGSFGIGFILSTRVKTNTGTEEESPWGGVSNAAPQTEQQDFAHTSLNGRTTGNGTGIDQPSDLVIHKTHPENESLSVLSTANNVSATTRLAKVNVMDELVANLQVADPAKRRKAIWELGQRGNSSAVQHLVNGMVDADSKEKSLILAALSEIGIRSLKPMNRALAIALQDDNPDVRKNAIRDLTRVYDLVTQISQMLGHATEDEDPEVRRTAEWALEQLNRIREAPKLKSSMNTTNTLEASRPPSELLTDEVENLKN